MLGIHQSLPKKLSDLPIDARTIGADTFQVFIRNNTNMKSRTFNQYDIDSLNMNLLNCDIHHFVVHASYAMNPCDSQQFDRCYKTMYQDLSLLQRIVGRNYYVLHPGSSKDLYPSEAIENLHNVLKSLIPVIGNTSIALEFMSGAGTQIFSDPGQIEYIMSQFEDIPNLSICYDTCHVFAAGYDIKECYEFLSKYISVLHLNNSSALKGTHVDRHASITKGYIPTNILLDVVDLHLDSNKDYPIILETPGANLLSDFMFVNDFVNKK